MIQPFIALLWEHYSTSQSLIRISHMLLTLPVSSCRLPPLIISKLSREYCAMSRAPCPSAYPSLGDPFFLFLVTLMPIGLVVLRLVTLPMATRYSWEVILCPRVLKSSLLLLVPVVNLNIGLWQMQQQS